MKQRTTVAEVIYKAMRHRNLRGNELAALSGVSYKTVSNWFCSRNVKYLDIMDALARALSCHWQLVPDASELRSEDLKEILANRNPQNWKELKFLKDADKGKKITRAKYTKIIQRDLSPDDIVRFGILVNKTKLLNARTTKFKYLEAAKKVFSKEFSVAEDSISVYATYIDPQTKCLTIGTRKLTDNELYQSKNQREHAEN